MLVIAQDYIDDKNDEHELFFYDENTPELEKRLYQSANLRHYLADMVTETVVDFDNYLSDDADLDYDGNVSYLHLEYSFEKNKGDDISNKLKLRTRIYLPKVTKRLRLIIENEDNTNDKYDDFRTGDLDHDRSLNVALEMVPEKENKWNPKGSVGIKVSKLDPYLKFTMKRNWEMTELWELEFRQKNYLYLKQNFHNTSSAEAFRDITPTIKFSNYNEFFWKEEEKIEKFYNSFRFFQRLAKRDYLSYVTSISTNNDESNMQVKEYQAYVSYRHYIKRWVYFDIVPKIIWPREHDFNAEYAFRFNFGIYIGNRKY